MLNLPRPKRKPRATRGVYAWWD